MSLSSMPALTGTPLVVATVSSSAIGLGAPSSLYKHQERRSRTIPGAASDELASRTTKNAAQ